VAGVAAVLLARIGQRLLRGLEPLPDLTEPPEAEDPAEGPGRDEPVTLKVVPQAGMHDEPTQPTGLFAAHDTPAPAGAWAWPAPHIRPVAPVSPELRAPAPVPARRAVEHDLHARTGAVAISGPRRSNLRPRDVTTAPLAVSPSITAPVGGRSLESHENIAVVGTVVWLLASLGLFLALTSSPSAALTLVLVLGAWNRLLPLERSPGTPRRGLALALLAGLALAADPVAPLFIWPPVFLSGLRWLREGERWPLLAPPVFAVGAAVAFLPLGGPGVSAAALGVLNTLGRGLGSGVLLAAAHELVASIGVVAALIAAVGAAVLLVRRPRLFVFTLASADLALMLVAGQSGPPGFAPGSSAWLVLVALVFAPLLLGMTHLAGKLGPARGGVALALAVVATVSPALDGGARRWHRTGTTPEGLLERAESRLGPAVSVFPGSPEMEGLLRYGQALGRRPDLDLVKAPPVQALESTPAP
jgi:hypothetical protein